MGTIRGAIKGVTVASFSEAWIEIHLAEKSRYRQLGRLLLGGVD